MKINLEINNKSQSPIEDGFFHDVAKEAFREMEFDFLSEKEISISLALVKESEIEKLNHEYRKVKKPTDVLSFPEFPTLKKIKAKKEKELFLGEIILCYDDIRKYTIKKKIDLNQELSEVFAHGILHLLGMQHGKKMFALQKKIAKNFCEK